MSKTILTDVDGVLLDYTGSFEDWILNVKFPAETIEESLYDFSTIEEWLGITLEESLKLIKEFNQTQYFSNLPSFEDAQEVVNCMKKEGYNFVAITACDDSEEAYAMRKRNLDKYFPNVFDDIIHTGLHSKEGKKPFLEKYKNAIWVEDTYKHALEGHKLGHKTFLMDGNRNLGINVEDGITRVNSWWDIFENV